MFKKGSPKPAGSGRKKGQPNKATIEIKGFARNFLGSKEYRKSLRRRILAGEANHMETLLHHYGFGRPPERVEGDPDSPHRLIVEHVEPKNTDTEAS